MSYCLNPDCSKPKNPKNAVVCQTCGQKLRLRDRYLVGKMLGQGGFGATFLALDLSLPGKPPCVIKQLRLSSTVPHVLEMARELFGREAETLGRIGNHPQVPRLLDYFEENQQFYLVQEYVSGHNLQQEIKRDGPLSEAGVKQFLSEILPMIQYIHDQKVIHRDIKPANLIRREQDKKLVLIDFGAVKNQVDLSAVANDQTALTAFAVGTPGFAPPEQMAMRPVFASDIYAVGITCLYLLTAKSPKDMDYNPKTGEMLWEKYVDISDHFANVLRKMLEVSVRHRYQSCNDALKALELEPYLDSLANDLIAPVNQKKSNEDMASGDLTQNTSATVNRTSNLAQSIRSRKSRRQDSIDHSNRASETSRTSSRYQPLPSTPRHNLPKKSKPPETASLAATGKLDAKLVISSYRKGRRDFGQQALNSQDFQQADLTGVIFHQSQLIKANFRNANLCNSDFGRASLNHACFRDANLGRSYFSYANLEGADLRGADLSHAYLNNAILKGANLCGANLSNAKITEEQLSQAKTNWLTVMPNGKRGLW